VRSDHTISIGALTTVLGHVSVVVSIRNEISSVGEDALNSSVIAIRPWRKRISAGYSRDNMAFEFSRIADEALGADVVHCHAAPAFGHGQCFNHR
jgi:hypothetical protein